MRGLSSLLVGTFLLSLGAWLFVMGGYNSIVLLLVSAGLFLLVRGLQGLGIAEAGDPTALADFVTDPADAIVDCAFDKAGEWMEEKKRKDVADPPGFDADAAFARYMAQRPELMPEQAPQAARGFGRKGL